MSPFRPSPSSYPKATPSMLPVTSPFLQFTVSYIFLFSMPLLLSLAHSDSSRKLTMIKEEFERNRHTLESRPAFTTVLMYWVCFAQGLTDRIDSGCVIAISGDRSDSHSQSTRIHFRLIFTVGASVAQRSADQIKHKHLPCLEYDMIVALL